MADFGLTTFEKDGKLKAVDNACKAVGNGETAIGIKCKNGVVLCVEKKLSSPQVDETSFQRIHTIDDHVGCTYAGLTGDARVLIKMARKICSEYWLNYGSQILMSSLNRETASQVHDATSSGGVRPYGCSLLFAGVTNGKPVLSEIMPSGAFYEWKATAVGKSAQKAKIFLEKRYRADLELEDGINTALQTLKDGFEGKMSGQNVEIAKIDLATGKFTKLTQSEVDDYIKEIE